MQAYRRQHPITKTAPQNVQRTKLVLVIHAQLRSVFSQIVSQMPEVVQQRGDDQFIGCVFLLGQMRALQRVLKLADPLAAVAMRACPPEQIKYRVQVSHCFQINARRMRADSTSIRLTVTTIISITAQVCAYWNPRMISHSTTPIPPAPTMPTTAAERTLDSKR